MTGWRFTLATWTSGFLTATALHILGQGTILPLVGSFVIPVIILLIAVGLPQRRG